MFVASRMITTAAAVVLSGCGLGAEPPEAKPGEPRDPLAADADRVVAGAFDLRGGREKFTALATERKKAWEEAAEMGDPSGMYLRAMCLFTGVGADHDPALASDLLRRAADKGSPHAQVMLGRICESADPKRALELYQKAADQGFAWGEYRLGVAHSEGRLVPRDEERAFELVLKAAEHGLAAGQTDAGSRYENGKGTAKDERLAFGWYQKAAEQGDAIGHLNVGVCHATGKGTPVDRETGEFHLNTAAQLGEPLAFEYLRSFDMKVIPVKDKRP